MDVINNHRYRSIPGFEGKYFLTECGQVWTQQYGTPRRKAPQVNRAGYVRVQLYKDNTRRHHRVNRLMALTFGDQLNPDELGPSHYVVDHINFIRDDNRLENLQLLSVKANRLRTRRNQLKVIRIE